MCSSQGSLEQGYLHIVLLFPLFFLFFLLNLAVPILLVVFETALLGFYRSVDLGHNIVIPDTHELRPMCFSSFQGSFPWKRKPYGRIQDFLAFKLIGMIKGRDYMTTNLVKSGNLLQVLWDCIDDSVRKVTNICRLPCPSIADVKNIVAVLTLPGWHQIEVSKFLSCWALLYK